MATEKVRKEAPPAEEEKEAPPAVEDKEAPAEEEEKEAPPAVEDKEAPPANVFPHFPDDIFPMIVAALPSREAYRTSVLSKANERMLREPLFLMSHLAPRPLLIGDEPLYIFIQPIHYTAGRRPGYTHVTLAKVHNNPWQDIIFNLPVKDEETGAIHFEGPRDATPAPDFFQQTLCLLDAEVVASHGRLVLARSATNYFVCNPERNRWVKLPLPTVIGEPIWRTAAGFCYDDLDGSGKQIDFNVVLLVPDRVGLFVQTLSSRVGTWVETLLGVNPIAEHLPPRSPGVFCEQRCYWLSRGHLICYDKGTGLLSVVGQPPLADMHPTRFHASLGSTGGKLRFSSCDIRDEHNKGGNLRRGMGSAPIPAAMKVWKLNDAEAGEWHQVYEDVMPLMYYATMVQPVDFASASNRTIILKHPERLRARNLDTGEHTFLTNLHAGLSLHSLYWSYFVFPYFG